MNKTPVIVIIGANFAGLAAAKHLTAQANVLVIDPNARFEYLPNIHELVSGEKSPTDLQLDRGELIRKMGHSWIQSRVTKLDAARQQLEVADGDTFEFDACIVAIGGVNDFHGVTGAAKYAHSFKSVTECRKIGERFSELKQSGKPFSVVVVGGGSEGVEALGELLRSRDHPHMRVHVVEGASRLLPELSAKAHNEILKICRDLPVDFHFDTRIEQVLEQSVSLSNGKSLSADLTIWTGGVKPHPLLHQFGLSPDADSWVPVKTGLQSEAFEQVFVSGDAAELEQTDSKQAYFATDSGELAAANVLRHLKGQSLNPFHSPKRPYLYSFGDLSCFLIWNDIVLAGKALSNLKEAVYEKSMLDMQTGDPCFRIGELYDRIVPKVMSKSADLLESFIQSPLEFLTKPALRML